MADVLGFIAVIAALGAIGYALYNTYGGGTIEAIKNATIDEITLFVFSSALLIAATFILFKKIQFIYEAENNKNVKMAYNIAVVVALFLAVLVASQQEFLHFLTKFLSVSGFTKTAYLICGFAIGVAIVLIQRAPGIAEFKELFEIFIYTLAAAFCFYARLVGRDVVWTFATTLMMGMLVMIAIDHVQRARAESTGSLPAPNRE